ncbi:hypothetical protein AAIE21_25905 [Paenibacillus sp. 102]|uniref:hypothetical protein n=1 Tax=Paenibacillus sp. 102 TaxID=3120823 RepID=UPI0031BA539A
MKKTGVLFILIVCFMLAACGNVEKTASESQEVKETQKSDSKDASQEVKETQKSDSKDASQEAKVAQKSDDKNASQKVQEKQEQNTVSNKKDENKEKVVNGESERNVPAKKEENLPGKQNIVLQNLQINCNEYDKEFILRAGDKIDTMLIESITNDEVFVKLDNGLQTSFQLGDGVSAKKNAGLYTITLTDIRDGHVTAYVLDAKCFQ